MYHPCTYRLLVGIVNMCYEIIEGCEIVECCACNGILFCSYVIYFCCIIVIRLFVSAVAWVFGLSILYYKD